MTDGPKFLPTQSVAQGRDWAMMCLTAIEKYIYLAASLNGEKKGIFILAPANRGSSLELRKVGDARKTERQDR
jgi:hypothetical protein